MRMLSSLTGRKVWSPSPQDWTHFAAHSTLARTSVLAECAARLFATNSRSCRSPDSTFAKRFWMEMNSALFENDRFRHVVSEGILVDALRGEGIVHIGQGDDAAAKRNLVAH